METIVENNVVDGTEMVPVETGEIVPVNNGEIQEVTAGQAALVLGTTMLVGYGLGKLGEFVVDKWITPGWHKLDDKLQARKRKKELEKKKDQVETSVITPEEDVPEKGNQKKKKDFDDVSKELRENGYKK